jgi:hypothetical protein
MSRQKAKKPRQKAKKCKQKNCKKKTTKTYCRLHNKKHLRLKKMEVNELFANNDLFPTCGCASYIPKDYKNDLIGYKYTNMKKNVKHGGRIKQKKNETDEKKQQKI